MEKYIFLSTNTTPSQSQQTSPNHSSNKRGTNNSFRRRMKNFFFCGLHPEKSPSLPVEPTTNQTNMTTTTEHQWYTTTCGENRYTLPLRYQDLESVGHGAFGSVVRATDTETGKHVAIKKMLQPFETPIHAKRTYRELKLLMYLNHPDAQIAQLYNVFTPQKTLKEFQTLYFVLKFADYDLNKVIRRRKPFTESHIQQIIYSLLRGLKFMHSAGIIHRDLKPANIGIDQNSDVTILDFGLARIASNDIQTGYVATRWWRAPEIYVNWKRYNEKLDMWGVGCIMAELILLRPIFPGTDHIDQLDRIFEISGTPDLTTVDEICTPDVAAYIRGLPTKPKKDLKELFGFKYDPTSQKPVSGVSSEGIDLLDRLLCFDHRLRPTAEEALAHPFLQNLHDPEEEPTIERMVDKHIDGDYTITEWKSIIWQMIEEFQPPPWVNDDAVDDS